MPHRALQKEPLNLQGLYYSPVRFFADGRSPLLQEPQYLSILLSRIPNAAISSDTSNRPQHDIGNYVALDVLGPSTTVGGRVATKQRVEHLTVWKLLGGWRVQARWPCALILGACSLLIIYRG